VFVSAVPAWGACDLSLDAATRLKADLLVHYGHNEFLRDTSNGVQSSISLQKAIMRLLQLSSERFPSPRQDRWPRTTIQHLHRLPEATKLLETKASTFGHRTRSLGTRNRTGSGLRLFRIRRIQSQVDSFLVIAAIFTVSVRRSR